MPTFTSSREASKDEMAREIDRCHKVIADLEARAEAAEERARVANGAVVNFEIAHAQPGRRIADLEARLARVLEDEAEHFIQAAIDRAPEPLRRLGEWLSKVLDEDQWATAERMLLGAATQPARVPSREDGSRPLPYDRETLGRFVREAWVRWAQTQPNPKPSWLAPYDDLSEPDKEADRQIGEAVARWTLIGDAASSAQLARVPSREEVARAIHDAQWPGIRLRKEHREKYLAYADAVLALFAKQETKP